ncbi:peptidase [Paenibacillus roseipurpureus]|uniref:Probable succinyl-diaminopimelate desuccinylase n=1 Tax=Paenibacillus roseopurpureus TaxID=2918901 RepID=A0AA96RN54_9BACL|nr:peptidase [Paenibacillus sp. MBLB1832]WNR46984.1 peptidase [Paenibacillus sp. MBLB1832]
MRIHAWLEQNRKEGISLLQKMVKTSSLQGHEQDVQLLVSGKLQAMGLDVDMWEPDGEELKHHPYFCSPRSRFTGSPNLVAVMKGSGGGRSLLLNGHVDVVPPGDRAQWQSDPFSGEILDGKLYGRGSTDMKGGNAALLLAMEAVQSLGICLQGDVIFQSVIEEESGGAGTLAAIVRGYRADAALIPEPTNMRIFPKQQGSMWFRIEVKGLAAHGGTRYEGVSAIEKSIIVIHHILALESQRNTQICDPLYTGNPIPIPINMGVIKGGNWPSSVPDTVTLEGRMGVAPEEKLEEAQQEMASWLARLPEKDPWFAAHPPELTWFGARWVPGSVDPAHPFMEVLKEQYEAVKGEAPLIEASPWGTDGGLLTQLGETPCIVFGPGITGVAHYPNEHIGLDDVFQAAEIIALTIIRWCGIDGGGMPDGSTTES